MRANVNKASNKTSEARRMSAMRRLVQGKRHVGKKALLAEYILYPTFTISKINLNLQYMYFYLILIWKFEVGG